MSYEQMLQLPSHDFKLLRSKLAEMERRGVSLAPIKPPTKPELVPAFQELWTPSRYKLYKGGRGSTKSWSFADALIWRAHTEQTRVLCTRELQVSIKDSVHRLLKDRITAMGLLGYFKITDSSIKSRLRGSEFLFKGLRVNAEEIKSTEGIDIAWVEEAEKTTAASLKILAPTIRRPGSELWFSWNPEEEDTAVDKLAKNPPPGSIVRHVSWQDNPYFTDELELERQYCLQVDPENYDWIWEGGYRKIRQGAIFGSRVVIEDFVTPEDARFFYGADWGFANDPTTLMRSFIVDNGDGTKDLFIDEEAFGYGVELEETAALFDSIAFSRKWPIRADNSRPETISYIKRQGFKISAASKWQGSVEDGITFLKSFRRIVIHSRCKHMQKEARLYSYKVDKVTGDILPIVVDAWNHGWDAVRYSLDDYIRSFNKLTPRIRSS